MKQDIRIDPAAVRADVRVILVLKGLPSLTTTVDINVPPSDILKNIDDAIEQLTAQLSWKIRTDRTVHSRYLDALE